MATRGASVRIWYPASRFTPLIRRLTIGSIRYAFAFPVPGLHGNLGRNIAFGPGYYEIDTALQKEFAVTERVRLKFRAEAFNLFNHPAYDVPSSVWTEVGKFGQITGILNGGAVGTGT